ncbi:gliding motility lipoprotein GldB [Faecalibacter rhinopitheci]|uniref:Gliding motility protein, GldB n=1 Tax=Faecalibacter rhinopitheci TaxID=2779678 RepID=A0A8J7FPJ9_9FLAO|nr:gliding motility protein, GldB [Faecalibacter rhinopitheci]MBF0597044.1 gliding motility protein, GldB [Faecalibacter rhinopitheci]MBQ0147693.1 gliding motility protein, GldB [Candidatus Onthonaster equi]
MRIFYSIAIIFILMLSSCKKEHTWDVDSSGIDVNLVIHDISKNFFNDSIPLSKLKTDYPFFFDNSSDSIWDAQRLDPKEKLIYNESLKQFGDFKKLDNELIPIFQKYKYYFPEHETPTVFLYSSGLQSLDYPVIYSAQDKLMFIAMDAFLGEKNKFYDSMRVENYLRRNMYVERVPAQVVSAIAENIVTYSPRQQKFLDLVLYEGKKLILQDALLTDTPDEYKIGYTPEQMAWCVENEGNIWNFFVEQNYVFSDDRTLEKRFLIVAPFSKFNNEVEQQSPGKIGAWIGWQIIRKYIQENPDVKLQDLLLDMDSQKILQASKYKPEVNGNSTTKYQKKKKEGVDELYHYAE